ncbi:hypothetical protein DM558_05840 [Entomomonas moraniae]|uniref:Peptidase M48 domain-containing protein n=1 Tax=Entomomonas moraniae TaxID=2213226 RepID=A0A3S9XD12_9GAMM|nr:M48 family metallopeptidase [Entomomonas moraniae]AZS50323.1 hypothetical protein DM558_05840 [Entomomonas moraniae]
MNFFKYQDQAKNQTFWLVVLFFAGLVIIPFIGAKIITFALNLMISEKTRPNNLFAIILTSLILITLLVSLYKYISLRQGGRVVAISLGGRLIDKKAATLKERQLLNVVEEMAIASSLPVPHVYILDDEPNINAFAAGYTINDAVIGVTYGCVELLTRDELQAVIAHEFSHILNGDMRLNLRFTSLLFGFIFVTQAGYTLLDLATGFNEGDTDKSVSYIVANQGTRYGLSGDKKKGGGFSIQLLVIAVALLLAGFIGQVWARIMQAAVNRQREYLADASSVQFTRHAKALASALKKIGGSETGTTLYAATAATYNHFFFSQVDEKLLATHPPLKKRILRIEPWWRGEFIKPNIERLEQEIAYKNNPELTQTQKTFKQKDKQIAMAIAVGTALTHSEALPFIKPISLLNTDVSTPEQAIAKIESICQEPMDACYLMFAILMDKIPSIRAKQFTVIKNTDLVTDYYQTLSLIPEERYLEFIEKAIPSLKNLSATQYKTFKNILMHFIQADKTISLKEWLLYQLITHQVDGQFNPKAIAQNSLYNHISQVKEEATNIITIAAYLNENIIDQQRAFEVAANSIGLDTIELPEKPSFTKLSSSLAKLQYASLGVRKLILQGILKTIEHDNKISTKEHALLRVLSLCLDCPIAL